MDSMIPIGQRNTLAEYMILSGADNRPPILDKDLYDSWKSSMELYMQNRENGRMILESVEHGPLIWPTIEENGVTRTKKYVELSATEKIQADCDMKVINIILQGLPTDIYSLVNHHRVSKDLWGKSLTNNASKFVTDVKLVKDLHTTNFDQLHAYLEQHELYENEGRQNSYAAGTSGTRANTSGTRVNYSGQQRVVKCFNCQREGHMARQCPKPKKKRDATWFGDKVLLVEAQGNGKVLNEEELEFLSAPGIVEGPVTQSVITHNATYQADDLDAYDFDCDEISTAKAVLMANLSSYGSDVLSKVPISDNTNNDILNQSMQEMQYSEPSHFMKHPENKIHSDRNIIMYSLYLIESQNAAVQDTNSSALQDALILSVFEQLSNQVTNCNKVNKDNLIANESLFAELEGYKERVKLLEERPNVDLDFGKRFVPQQELSDEQALHLITDQFASLPAKIKALQELPKENDLRKFKGKDIVDNAAQVSNATTIALGMYKLDPVILAPKIKNNRDAHEYYLKHTMEQAAILREVVEQAKSRNPLDSASYSACMYVKLIQELLGYVRDNCPDIHKPSEKLVAVMLINKKKIVRFANTFTSSSNVPKVPNRPLLSSTRVNPFTSASGSKPSGNTKSDRI
ncbi:reverse transcriptase domain-containing protein [Tanacetum coccineum]